MFHLFNRVYLAGCTEWRNDVPHYLLSSQISEESRNELTVHQAPSLESLLLSYYDSNLQSFIDDLRSRDTKVILNVDASDYYYLQLALWKSIFKVPSTERLHLLHQTQAEARRLRVQYSNPAYQSSAQSPRYWGALSQDDIRALGLPTLDVKGTTLSTEYYWAYYYRENEHPGVKRLIDQYRRLFEAHYLRVAFKARERLVRCGYDLARIPALESLDRTPGRLIQGLSELNDAVALLDNGFCPGNSEHVRHYYSVESLAHLVDAAYGAHSALGSQSALYVAYCHVVPRSLLKAEVVNALEGVMYHAYDDLRINTGYVSYLYGLIRKHDEVGLTHFELKEELLA